MFDPQTAIDMIDYVDSIIQSRPPLGAELQVALNLIPAHTWYAVPSGALTFLNERGSDYLGLPKDDPIRLGIDTGAAWDSHIPLLHPDDHEETRRVWSTCLRTGCAGQISFRVRNAEGGYRWFLSRAEPIRASDGTLLYWIGVNLDIQGRKQAEFYLAEGQRLAHMGSWVFNAAGFDYWSPELFRIHGLDPSGKAPTVEEYMGLVHPEDREFVTETIQRLIAEGRGFDFTKRIVRPDGEIRRVRCVGSRATHAGAVQEFIGTGMDVTEHELLTQELGRREAYLAEAQRLSHTGSFGWKPDTGEIMWSAETYRIFQYDRTTKPTVALVLQRVHPEDVALVKHTIERAAQDGKDFVSEHRLLMPDGSIKNVHAVAHALRDGSGSIEFVGAVMDVTRQHQARAALERAFDEIKRSEDRLRLVIDTIPGMVWSALPDGSVDFVNQPWMEYHGLTWGNFNPDSVLAALHPDDVASAAQNWRTALATGKHPELELRVRRADGEYRWFLKRAVPLRDELGNIVKWYGTITDIEDRRRAEMLLTGEKRLLGMIARGDSRAVILDAFCRLFEELSTGSLSSILLLDPKTNRLRHGAAPSLPMNYTEAIDGLVIGPSVGSCGTAAYRAEPVIVSDIDTDPLWADYRDLALAHGLRACWSRPILSSDRRVLGTFATYYREPRSPTPQEHNVIEQVAHLASIALEREQAAAEREARRAADIANQAKSEFLARMS